MRPLAGERLYFFASLHIPGESQHGATGRPDDDVGAGAARPLLNVVKDAPTQAHDGQDQCNRNAYKDGAEEGAHRPVLKVFPNQSIDQVPSLSVVHISAWDRT